MSENFGGPAFPSANDVSVGDIQTSGHAGMTLRDYFAAQALQGLIAEPLAEGSNSSVYHINGGAVGNSATAFAQAAYRLADAMLNARQS